MKIFSGGKPVSPAAARNCFLMNQFATPGLGSLMGGRVVPGLGQLLLFLLGFLLFLFWFVRTIHGEFSLLTGDIDNPGPSYTRYAISGLLFCGAGWLWALLTSMSLVRESKASESKFGPTMPPPRITNPPPKM
jgi:hypothetical protein